MVYSCLPPTPEGELLMLFFILSIIDLFLLIKHLNIGGGIGIKYIEKEKVITPKELITSIFKRLNERKMDHIELILEPGRSIVGNAGILLTTVQYIKTNSNKTFAVVDAAMNDLLRPTLYKAYHGICPVIIRNNKKYVYDIVGPICESGDWIAKDRVHYFEQGDVIAIESTGAYGMVMSSNYNSRPRAAEVIVDKNNYCLIRQRETLKELLRNEYTI